MALAWLDVETRQAEELNMSAHVCRHSSWGADFPHPTEDNIIKMLIKLLNEGAKEILRVYISTKNMAPDLDSYMWV